jgi:dTDP-4-dehydrorhamnose reductase
MTGRRPQVLVLGGSGLVGSRFVELTGERFDLEAPPHAALDVLDGHALATFLRASPAEVVLNATARADVDSSEAERGDLGGSVYRMNALVPGQLAELCGATGKHLVHLSTDYVFDGQQENRPYVETDPPNPLSWYAETKHQGELRVQATGLGASVVRVEMPFSPLGHHKLDFARLCASRLRTATEVVAVEDQRVTPVFLDDCVEALARIIERRPPGLMHVASADWTTPFDFARRIASELSLDHRLIRRERFERFATFRPAPRPRHSWLDIHGFEQAIGREVLRPVDDQVRAWAARLAWRTHTSTGDRR